MGSFWCVLKMSRCVRGGVLCVCLLGLWCVRGRKEKGSEEEAHHHCR